MEIGILNILDKKDISAERIVLQVEKIVTAGHLFFSVIPQKMKVAENLLYFPTWKSIKVT